VMIRETPDEIVALNSLWLVECAAPPHRKTQNS
jgi:hypothetical protein